MAGIKSITVTNAGSGYTTLPTVAIGGTGGNIVQIDIDNPGSGYIGSHTWKGTRGLGLDHRTKNLTSSDNNYNGALIRIVRRRWTTVEGCVLCW